MLHNNFTPFVVQRKSRLLLQTKITFSLLLVKGLPLDIIFGRYLQQTTFNLYAKACLQPLLRNSIYV